jgi:hypothetical protein
MGAFSSEEKGRWYRKARANWGSPMATKECRRSKPSPTSVAVTNNLDWLTGSLLDRLIADILGYATRAHCSKKVQHHE